MSQTITIRLSKELSEWLEDTAQKTGMPQGRIVREQLEKARASQGTQAFMKLVGCVRGGPRDVSKRKGFSTK